MTEAGVTLMFLLLAPWLAYVILRNEVTAFFVSAPLGMLTLVGYLVHREVNAPDSDIDIVFELGCILMAMTLAALYAALFLGIYVVRRRLSQFGKSNDRP